MALYTDYIKGTPCGRIISRVHTIATSLLDTLTTLSSDGAMACVQIGSRGIALRESCLLWVTARPRRVPDRWIGEQPTAGANARGKTCDT